MSLWFRNEYDDLALGPVFGVNDDCESIDESQPPSTAEEYLRRCMREAKSYNFCADPQRDELRRLWSVPPNPTHVERQVVPVPEACLPTKEWEINQLKEFSRFHRALLSYHSKKIIQIPSTEREWCLLCFGNDFWLDLERSRNPSDRPEKSRKRTLMTKQVLPTPQLMSQLRGHVCAILIAMHLDWAEELGMKSPHQVMWIYSILGVLEKPISSDIASNLRSLVLICTKERKMLVEANPDINFDGEMMIHLNILHTIITHFFQQFDLADYVSLGDDPNWRWQDEEC